MIEAFRCQEGVLANAHDLDNLVWASADIVRASSAGTKPSNKLQNKISANILDNLTNIKYFPVFVSKSYLKPVDNIFLVGDAFFAFSPSFAQGASQSIEGANQLHEIIINQKNHFYNSRLERVKMINRRSDFNQFAFHLSNPIMIFFRNIFLKLLTKNKKFLQSYLGKIYKN